MDGNLAAIDGKKATPVATPAAEPVRAPERIALLCRKVMAHPLGGPVALDLPDLAGCYGCDL